MAAELLMQISQDERERARLRSRRMFETDMYHNIATAEERGELIGKINMSKKFYVNGFKGDKNMNLQIILIVLLCFCIIGCKLFEKSSLDEWIRENIAFNGASFTGEISIEREIFIRNILADFNHLHSYFVALNVESPEYKGKTVIRNVDLWRYFRDSRTDSPRNRHIEYDNVMYGVLKEKLTLKIASEDLKKYGFRTVPNDETVIANARNGVDYFVKYYFNRYPSSSHYGVIKEDYVLYGSSAIIAQLFNFNIAAKQDCETGYLVIHYSTVD